MNVAEILLRIPAREVAGSTAQDRFHYQHAIGFSRLIKEHAANRAYAIAFEVHEDIVHFNSEQNPSKAILIQVKTQQDGEWTLSSLIAPPGGSFIAKLLTTWSPDTRAQTEYIFATNTNFEFQRGIGMVKAADLGQRNKQTVLDAIQGSQGSYTEQDLGTLIFEVSHLNLANFTETLLGEVHVFLKTAVNSPEASKYVDAWYGSICQEILRCNRFPANKITTFNDLIKNKCIKKSEIDATLVEISKGIARDRGWGTISQGLNRESFAVSDIIRLEKQWDKLRIMRLNALDDTLKELLGAVDSAVAEAVSGGAITLTDLLSRSITSVDATGKRPAYYDIDLVRTAILASYYEQS